MITDAKFSTVGFKYPDRVFGKNVQEINQSFVDRPIIIKSQNPRPKNAYVNFGKNWGPSRP